MAHDSRAVEVSAPAGPLLALILLAACGGTPQAALPPVPARDYADAGVPFQKDEIVPSAAFTDFTALTAAEVEAFLAHDPYTGASFLATYQSNGVAFSDAVANVASRYRINPIVLLVAVEATLGLVADTVLPQPAPMVDYLFGCGCAVPTDTTTCAASAAGLDIQLACYASTLRSSLDQIAISGATPGGWGPGVAATSLDAISVTPVDDSTAALYAYDPVVGTGRSGNSLFASIWSEYTTALTYSAPQGTSTGATAQVGDPCLASSDCAIASAICATGPQYQGGMCTAKCAGSCPGSDSFCASFSQGGFCLALCNPTDPASCRAAYACSYVAPSGAPSGTAPQYVCTPR